jgi:hypothetical protein
VSLSSSLLVNIAKYVGDLILKAFLGLEDTNGVLTYASSALSF